MVLLSNFSNVMRAVIIYNPYAGSGQAQANRQALDAAANIWREHGWQVSLNPTTGPGDATRLAHLAAHHQYDLVVAAGGDGTINEVVNGLAGSSTVLATLPFGTVNVWARELGLPLQPRAAAETMLSWQVRTIDLGRADGRYFLLMAGVGFDATITYGVNAAEKRRLGALAYVLLALKTAWKIRGTRVRITLDGRRVRRRVLMVVLGNTQLYGGILRITRRARIDDGLLDVCVLKGNTLWSGLSHALSLLSQRTSLDPEIEYYRARTVQITGRPGLRVQVDGDTIGQTPMHFDVAPRALQALMPPLLPDGLVSRPAAAVPGLHRLRRLLFWWWGQPERTEAETSDLLRSTGH